jgi:uroporphyrinogen III methyltransferase/synthase
MGTVWLVGAGPGDPGLITVRGRELLATCDCVVHDYLVSPEILDLVAPAAVRHDVGKRGRSTSAKQEDINALLVDCGRSHRQVVRLKGGDPFLFGRGGEECAALAAAGVPFAVVPGVTSGTGVPAYAGIPVTHRASSSAVVFVAGHQQKPSAGETVEPIDWATFAKVETIVLYMGLYRLAANCAALVAAGREATTPVAVIQWGTYHRQRTVTGTLADIGARVEAAGLAAPAITVVGDVVRWREQIRWFDDTAQRPLWGRRVLVTRASAHAGNLAQLLSDAGAEILHLPLARHEPALGEALSAAVAAPADWIGFASVNAVDAVCAQLEADGRDLRALAGRRLAAIGPATAAALRRHGLRADLVAEPATADGLADALATVARGAILLPRADNGRDVLADRLREAGWRVRTVVAYRTVPEPIAPAVLDGPAPHAISLASAATVSRLVEAIGRPRLDAWIAGGTRLYAIGPQTAAAAEQLGLAVAAQAAAASVEALVAAIAGDLAPR